MNMVGLALFLASSASTLQGSRHASKTQCSLDFVPLFQKLSYLLCAGHQGHRDEKEKHSPVLEYIISPTATKPPTEK